MASDGRMARVGILAASILIGLFFILMGFGKFGMSGMWLGRFQTWGLPAWLVPVSGVLESAGGLLLLFPRTSPAGGALLGTVMLGACMTHLVHAEWPNAAFTAGLMAVVLLIARHRLRRRQADVP